MVITELRAPNCNNNKTIYEVFSAQGGFLLIITSKQSLSTWYYVENFRMPSKSWWNFVIILV